jgi:hypothetical protein
MRPHEPFPPLAAPQSRIGKALRLCECVNLTKDVSDSGLIPPSDLTRKIDSFHGNSDGRHVLKLMYQLERFADGEIGC